jgi:hypothetical protein
LFKDWMRLSDGSSDLSGRDGAPLRYITLAELREHRTKDNAWTAIGGKASA